MTIENDGLNGPVWKRCETCPTGFVPFQDESLRPNIHSNGQRMNTSPLFGLSAEMVVEHRNMVLVHMGGAHCVEVAML